MVHEGNKDESEKCFSFARKYFDEGNREKAVRFAQKAERLFPSQKTKDFIELLNRLSESTGSSKPQNNNASAGGSSAGASNGTSSTNKEHFRQRRRPTNDEPPADKGGDYTPEQLVAVKGIKKCKDYYEILGITKEAGDTELKKAYRRLALQFHPDKNKAPGADEAFKAVGNAFAILSEPEKRKQYDLYGPDEANSGVSQRNTQTHTDFTRGYEGDMTAEELFNMFFGGGYPGGGMYVRRGGRWERTGAGGGGAAAGGTRSYHQRGHHHHETAQHSEQSSWSVFLQLMPLLLILLLSLASSLLSSDPTYSLSPSSKYTVQRTTSNLGINFYVKPDFSTEYQGSIKRLEQHVEEDYVTTLRNACFKEKNYKENMIWRARSFGDSQMFRRAQDLRTPSCDNLQNLYNGT